MRKLMLVEIYCEDEGELDGTVHAIEGLIDQRERMSDHEVEVVINQGYLHIEHRLETFRNHSVEESEAVSHG